MQPPWEPTRLSIEDAMSYQPRPQDRTEGRSDGLGRCIERNRQRCRCGTPDAGLPVNRRRWCRTYGAPGTERLLLPRPSDQPSARSYGLGWYDTASSMLSRVRHTVARWAKAGLWRYGRIRSLSRCGNRKKGVRDKRTMLVKLPWITSGQKKAVTRRRLSRAHRGTCGLDIRFSKNGHPTSDGA